MRESVTRLDVAEHILEQAASGVRDLDRLKNSAFENAERGCLFLWRGSGYTRKSRQGFPRNDVLCGAPGKLWRKISILWRMITRHMRSQWVNGSSATGPDEITAFRLPLFLAAFP
jgi:hypothetical protein